MFWTTEQSMNLALHHLQDLHLIQQKFGVPEVLLHPESPEDPEAPETLLFHQCLSHLGDK